MTPEEFAAYVREVIETEVSAGIPCSCCNTVEIDGIGEAVSQIMAKFAEITD